MSIEVMCALSVPKEKGCKVSVESVGFAPSGIRAAAKLEVRVAASLFRG